jgi:CheY-like chemotaxis protein
MHHNGHPPHILAVNDSADVLALFKELLEEEGYRVSTMPVLTHDIDGAASLNPDLMVLDYMWSTEDDNWALLQMLRMEPRTKAIPIILCTGAVRQVEPLSARLGEMNVQILFKPFDLDELLGMVTNALGRDNTSDPALQPFPLDGPDHLTG